MEIKIYKDNQALAEAFASFFADWLTEKESVNIALSGGSTPKVLFRHWAETYKDRIDWRKIHFFWGDERCVPPDHPESNFGMTKKLLFDHINITRDNIHRIEGEAPAEQEAARYSLDVEQNLPLENGFPVFDLIMLGMGADGHTASIFPNQMELLWDERICVSATHPDSGQKRVSLSGSVINNARLAVFLVAGASKTPVLSEIMNQTGDWRKYPAAHIENPGRVIWFLDEKVLGETT